MPVELRAEITGTRQPPRFLAPILADLPAWMPRLVGWGLALAAMLALVMALVAPVNHRPDLWRGPPDEHGHRAAARFYVEHWLPPRVGDPATLDSYSREYGLSYLNTANPTYFFAGKFAAVVAPLVRDADRALRLFNVALLLALALVCMARPGSWPVFVPLLLTPQVWYVFSYFNNDGFALFLGMLLAWQVADPGSAFNRFLDAPRMRGHLLAAAAIGVAIGLLALAKENYRTLLAFAAALVALVRLGRPAAGILFALALAGAVWIAGRIAVPELALTAVGSAGAATFLFAALQSPATRAARVRLAAKVALVAAIACAVVGARQGVDAWLHGSIVQKEEAASQLRERIARPEYRPSASGPIEPRTYPGLWLRARGVPIGELFKPGWDWHFRTFATATGSYGWTEFAASTAYRAVLLSAYAALAVLAALAAARSGFAEARAGFFLVVAFCALTVGASLLHSWNADFTPQGRYLFPMIPMAGVGLFLARDGLALRAFAAAAAFAFLLSLHSFVFVGLARVPGSF